MIVPETLTELQEALRAHDQVLPVGGRTKERLGALSQGRVERISMTRLSGVQQYDPAEYTFTALAGTPMKLIEATLAEKGQFLPCSAPLMKAGATLGGTIASGLSGAGRFRFGGVRDFLLGIRYVNGEGECISSGGKVVKNAAGFDLPKFMVGSLGRFGILAEVTFKVFPRPLATRTLQVRCPSHEEAVRRLCTAASSRWELSALDYVASEQALYFRLGGPLPALEALGREIQQRWVGEVRVLEAGEAEESWTAFREFSWRDPGGALVKVPVSPKRIPELQQACEDLGIRRAHYSAGGNVAYLSVAEPVQVSAFSEALAQMEMTGLTFLGRGDTAVWLGHRASFAIEKAIKRALDPMNRFPALTDE